MANTIKCGDCIRYHEMRKPLRSGKGYTRLMRGHCLAKSIYAKDRPGNPVYPPGAKIETLPHNRHQIVVVRDENVESGCTDATGRPQ